LVDAHYHQDYHIWKLRLDANKRATDYLVNHLRDPSGTVAFSQAIEAPVSIPFVPTVRAAELRWWNGYLITYLCFNDLILLRGGHYQNSFNRRPISTTILQVRQPTIRLPPNPDFNSLSQEEKDRIYQDLHNQVDSLVLQRKSFAHRELSRRDTGPAQESGLAIQEFVIAFVCRFQVILSHGYISFPMIDDLRQRLLD
jgi:hypothetical protein